MGTKEQSNMAKTAVFDIHALGQVIRDVGLDEFLDQLIEKMTHAFIAFDPEKTQSRMRAGFSYSDPRLGLVEWMPVRSVEDVVAVKTVGYHPDNPSERSLPSVLATTAIYDTKNGVLLALCEATVLTALRTGAASAIMTDRLAAEGPITLGVVGCGAQAVTQIHAISRVRELKRIVVTDFDLDTAKTLQSRLPSGIGPVEIVSLDQFSAVVGDFDVLCTCTSVDPGQGPVVDLAQASPGLHVNAVGSDFPGKTELPIEFLKSAVVVPDLVEQCLAEGEAQVLRSEDLGPQMVEIIADPHGHRSLRGESTVFDSTGWSYEDLLAAQLFIEHARRLGLGVELALTPRSGDPFDPFAAIRQADSPLIGDRI